MKKMTFALACASAVAAFAWVVDSHDEVVNSQDWSNTIGFEDYTVPFKGLSGKADDGTDGSAASFYWLYAVASGSEDGSTVKAYGGDNLAKPTIGDHGSNYLELSTEGGTLWRSINTLASSTELGEAKAVPETGLYVDTMVQFTATEDGGEPTLDPTDKLAIWLRVTTDAEDATKSVTNLCVRGCAMTTEGSGRNETPVATPTTFVLTGAEVEAGTWHNLTVRAIGNIVDQNQVNGDFVSGFVVEIDGKTMRIANNGVSCDSKFTGYYEGSLVGDAAKLITDGQFIPSLMGYQNEDKSALQAVGFKGSGAIDNLSISDTVPTPPTPPASAINLTISAENATVAGITAGTVKAGDTLSFTVTPAAGYTVASVKINGEAVTAVDGTYSYTVQESDTAVAVVVTTEAIPSIDWDHPDTSAGTTAGDMFKLTGPIAAADGAKVAAWAKKYSVSFADASTTIKMDAFLLNCANEDAAIFAAKANFKIVSIEQNAQGDWVAKVTGDTGDGGAFGNGYVVIKGSATVNGTYELATTDKTARFFKAFLVLEAPAASVPPATK